MMLTAVALVVYVAAAFFGADEPRYAVFTSKEACDQAVAEVRASGTFASDCVAVTIPAPKNGAPRT